VSKILHQRLRQVEFARNCWAVTPERTTTFEDMLSPAYWSHVARTLKQGDRIEVLADDFSYFAELIVTSTADTEANVAVLRKVELGEAKASPKAETDECEVTHRGTAGWSVIRKSDKTVLFEKGETKAQAKDWLAKHVGTALA
jgi:hypothetical protein